MIPKIHAKGTSFQGIAKYVLHDKQAETTKRVAWSETVNLGTRNPHVAWKVMAATSMNQDRLKKEAGIKNTGRKSKEHVQHVTLSWHAKEAKELTRDEQVRAAKWFLREIKADDRQVMIVAHNDEPQPHVHIIINRVSPTDGRILPSSFEKMKSSRWAEKYEKERGEIFCHQRVINNAARKRGEYVRGEKETARHVYEAQQQVANDNSEKQALLAQHREKAASIAKQDREDRARHKREFEKLQVDRKTQLKQLKEQLQTNVNKSKQLELDGYRPRWVALHHDHQQDLKAFDKNEKTLKGRMQNALKLVQWRNLIGRQPGERTTLSNAFRVFSSEGSRREALERQFKLQEKQLKKEQDAKIKTASAAAKLEGERKIASSRPMFEQKRNSLILKHQLERSKTRTRWHAHDRQQREAWKDLAIQYPVSDKQKRKEELLRQFRQAGQERDKGIDW